MAGTFGALYRGQCRRQPGASAAAAMVVTVTVVVLAAATYTMETVSPWPTPSRCSALASRRARPYRSRYV